MSKVIKRDVHGKDAWSSRTGPQRAAVTYRGRADAENDGIEIIKLNSEYAVSTQLCLTAVAGSVPSPHWAANSPHSEIRSLAMSKAQCERLAL